MRLVGYSVDVPVPLIAVKAFSSIYVLTRELSAIYGCVKFTRSPKVSVSISIFGDDSKC